ncbi:MAG: LCP family protein [Mycobacteriales bacterium]
MSTDEPPGDPIPEEPTGDDLPQGNDTSPAVGESAAQGSTGSPPPFSPRHPRHLKATRHAAARRRTALAAKVVAMLSSLAVLFYSGWAWSIVKSADNSVNRIPITLPGPAPLTSTAPAKARSTGGTPSQGGVPAATEAADIDGKSQNILIVGNDNRAGYTSKELAHVATGTDGGGFNTDTILILHIPANGSRASIVSIPRDTWVAIPGGFKDGKVNEAYPDGACFPVKGKGNQCSNKPLSKQQETSGAQILVQTVSNLTGLHIDHYVEISLIGFYRLSNSIGGVNVCLKKNVNDPWTGLELTAGKHTIKGKRALQFVRQRHNFPKGAADGDLNRIKRQQTFLAAAANKIISAHWLLEPWKLTNVADSVAGAMVADQHFSIIELAKQMRDIGSGNVRFLTMPTQGPAPEDPDSLGANPMITRLFFQQVVEGTLKTAPARPSKSARSTGPPARKTGPSSTKPTASTSTGARSGKTSGRSPGTSAGKSAGPTFDVQQRSASDNSCVY